MKEKSSNNHKLKVEKELIVKKEGKQMDFVLPPGTRFDDIYMDGPQVAQELNISKRVVRNIRASGKISFTNPFGKIFYYRQEIAAIMEAAKTAKRSGR